MELPSIRITNTATSYRLKYWNEETQTFAKWRVTLEEFIARVQADGRIFGTDLSHEKRFPAYKLVIESKRQCIPRVTFLYFKHGKVVQVGAKSSYESCTQRNLFKQLVERLFHVRIAVCAFQITNICASGKLDAAMDLVALHDFLISQSRSQYQPNAKETVNAFPALRGVVNPDPAAKKRMFTLYPKVGSFNLIGNKCPADVAEGQMYMGFVKLFFKLSAEQTHAQTQRGAIQRARTQETMVHMRQLHDSFYGGDGDEELLPPGSPMQLDGSVC